MSISVAMLSMAAAWKLSSRRDCRAQKGSSCVSTRTMKEHNTMKEPAGKTKRVLRLAASTFMPSSSGMLVLGVVAQLGNRQSCRSTGPHRPVQQIGPFFILGASTQVTWSDSWVSSVGFRADDVDCAREPFWSSSGLCNVGEVCLSRVPGVSGMRAWTKDV